MFVKMETRAVTASTASSLLNDTSLANLTIYRPTRNIMAPMIACGNTANKPAMEEASNRPSISISPSRILAPRCGRRNNTGWPAAGAVTEGHSSEGTRFINPMFKDKRRSLTSDRKIFLINEE